MKSTSRYEVKIQPQNSMEHSMTNKPNSRVRLELTPEQQRRIQLLRQEVTADVPTLKSTARDLLRSRIEMGLREPTLSGQLRQAITTSGLEFADIATELGVTPKELTEFMTCQRGLDSLVMDKLATLLRQELRPVG
ncbi:MAG: hypothetical protein ACKV0T_13140 [Planctomycetales bacterium]